MKKVDLGNRKVSFIGYFKDENDDSFQIYEDKKDNLYIKYREEMYEVIPDFRIVPKGTYNQEVNEVPYFVMNNNVYPFEKFIDILEGE